MGGVGRLDDFVVLEDGFDHGDRAVEGAAAVVDDLLGIAAEGFAAVGIGEEGIEGGFEGLGVGDLDGGIGFEEAGGDIGEVLHIGAEDDGAAGGGGFDGVLAADAVEAFADEDDVGVGVEVAELAGAVDQEAIGAAGFGGIGEADFAAVDVAEAAAVELGADGAGAFEVAGDEDEVEVGVFGAESGEDFGEGGFFAVVGAAGEEDAGVVGHAGVAEEAGDVEGAGVGGGWGFEFEAADGVDGVGVAAEGDEAVAVAIGLGADGIEAVEEVTEEEGGLAVAGEGALGDAGVDEGDGDAAAAGLPEHVGPQFGFDEDEDFGVEDGEGAADPGAAVDGAVDFFDGDGEFAAELGHAGGGGGGDDEFEGGEAGFEGADEEGGEVDLADADGVDPDDAAVGEGLFDAWGVGTEAFAEAFPPSAAAPEAEEVVGEGENEADGEEDVVDRSHSLEARAGPTIEGKQS